MNEIIVTSDRVEIKGEVDAISLALLMEQANEARRIVAGRERRQSYQRYEALLPVAALLLAFIAVGFTGCIAQTNQTPVDHAQPY